MLNITAEQHKPEFVTAGGIRPTQSYQVRRGRITNRDVFRANWAPEITPSLLCRFTILRICRG